MGHNWYKENFKKKLRKLKERKKNATGYELKLINETIEALNYLIYEDEKPIYSINGLLESDYEYLSDARFIKPTLDIFSTFALPDNFIYGRFVDFRYPLSNDELIALAHDFFKNATNKQTFELFLKIYNRHKKNVHFFHDENSTFSADTTFLPFYHESFIKFNRTRDFDDIHTLTHEFGHTIQSHRNFNSRLYSSIFAEIVSLFFEFISLEYFSKDIELQDMANVCLIDLYDKSITSTENILREFDIIKQIRDNSSGNISSVRRAIRSYVKNTPKEILDELIEVNPSADLIYDVGSMIAMELFMMYINDPDKAFYTLYKIIDLNLEMPDKDYYDEIKRLGIIPGGHTEAYKQYLTRKLGK